MTRSLSPRVVVVVALSLVLGPSLDAADCNQNGIEEALDLAARSVGFRLHHDEPLGMMGYRYRAGDLDGDGDDDLVTLDQSAAPNPHHDRLRSFSVLLQEGPFDVALAGTYELPAAAFSAVLVDIDGDARQDSWSGAQTPCTLNSPVTGMAPRGSPRTPLDPLLGRRSRLRRGWDQGPGHGHVQHAPRPSPWDARRGLRRAGDLRHAGAA